MGIFDRFRLDGQVAIVTGAGRGIGAAIAAAYAEAGAHVVCAARSRDQIERTAAAARAHGVRALAVPCDVLERAQLEGLVDATLKEFGRIDLLVNNAGGWSPKPALRTSEKEFEAAFRFNVTTAFVLTRLAVPKMVETAAGGAIVNISSRSSDMVQTSFVAYGAAKAALNMMTRNLAAEIAPKVRVNAISVGGVATDALQVVLTNDDLRAQFEANTPMGRPGQPNEVAPSFLFLACEDSSYMTGQVLHPDGGDTTSS